MKYTVNSIRLTVVILAVSLLAVLTACGQLTVEELPIVYGEEQQMVVVRTEPAPIEYEREVPAVADDPFLPANVQAVQAAAAPSKQPIPPSDEVRSVWISYLEMDALLKNKTADQFQKNISSAFEDVKKFGLNTVVVHVRPFGDAFYRSDYFPWSYLITGTEGRDPGFDPLQIMVEEAKKQELRLEAWINPYRVRASGNNNALCADNPARIWMEAGESHVIRYNGVISYNPASELAQELIVNGVREIVRNYDVDAIHIDDYFYPTTATAFDQTSYQVYQDGGGTLALADWRRSNVETLVRKLYAAVKDENPKVLFGVSPQSSVSNNYDEQYLDVKKIAATPGYCDYLCPQIYFGFENDIQPYAKTLKEWDNMVTADGVSLYVGLAAYKAGGADSWAGSGAKEWQQNTNLLSRMVTEARGKNTYQGFVLYRYDSLFQSENGRSAHMQTERENLKKIL